MRGFSEKQCLASCKKVEIDRRLSWETWSASDWLKQVWVEAYALSLSGRVIGVSGGNLLFEMSKSRRDGDKVGSEGSKLLARKSSSSIGNLVSKNADFSLF